MNLSHLVADNPTEEFVRGVRAVAHAAFARAARCGSTIEADHGRHYLTQFGKALFVDADALEAQILVALRSGSECADLGRTVTEGPDEGEQDAPRSD